MKEVLMTNAEYAKYKEWKAQRDNFEQMKRNGELFYVDLNSQLVCGITVVTNGFNNNKKKYSW